METTKNRNPDELKVDSLPCDVCLYFRRQIHLDKEAESEFRFHLDRKHGLVP